METKLKFKVGDKVRVKSLEWYNENKNIDDEISYDGIFFLKGMSRYCGESYEIVEVINNGYGCYKFNGIIFFWYDWMLEDYVITEEKQEVEQLNQKDMETKEMTKEEVLEFLKDTKILCTSKAETIQVQVKLFQFGIEWISKTKGVCEDRYLLFINKKQELQHCSDIDFWMKDVNKRIEPSEILSIQIKEEKPKFDPKTLQDFQKVLYRSSNADWWRLGFFEYYNEIRNNKFWIIGQDVQPYEQCVPYNEETEYLKGTSLVAPEVYENW